MELTNKDREFLDAIKANTPKGFPHLVCGWTDAEHGITWDAYIQWAHDLIDELKEGSDVGAFQTYAEWCEQEREGKDDLGFSWQECDLCGSQAGERYAATALPSDPDENPDYIAMAVCGDCIMWLANGDLPQE